MRILPLPKEPENRQKFIPRVLRNGVFEPRESSRDSTIGNGGIDEIQPPFPIVEPRGFDALKCTIPKHTGYNLTTGPNIFFYGLIFLYFLTVSAELLFVEVYLFKPKLNHILALLLLPLTFFRASAVFFQNE